jgi:hypothetical protein
MKFEIFRDKAQESLNLLYKEIFRINTF